MNSVSPAAIFRAFLAKGAKRQTSRLLICSTSALALMLAQPTVAIAQDLTWDGGSSGQWTGAGNWRDNGTGNSATFANGDTVELDQSGGVDVTITGTVAPGAISLNQDNQNIQGGVISSASAAGGGPLIIDFTGRNDDSTISSALSGDFTVRSSGSTIDPGRLTFSGRSAQITSLTIESGGSPAESVSVTNTGIMGNFTVDPFGGGVIFGPPSVAITNNGNFTNTNDGVINGSVTNTRSADLAGRILGDVTGSSGTITITGGDLNVGDGINNGPNSEIRVSDGDLSAESLTNEGVVTVGSGQTLTVRVAPELINRNGGELNVQGGGAVASSVVNGLNSTVTLDGTIIGNLTTEGTVNGRGTVQGNLIVNNGTTSAIGGTGDPLIVTGTLDINRGAGTFGTVEVISGNLTAGNVTNAGVLTLGTNRTLTITAGQVLNENGGILTVGDGSRIDGDVTNDAGGTVNLNNGTIDGTLTTAGTVEAAGRVTGLVTVNNGSLTTTGGLTLDTNLDINADAVAGTRGSVIVSGGDMAVADVDNAGNLTVNNNSRLTIGANGEVTNEAGGVVTVSSGTIAGNVTNNIGATVNLDGTVTGNLVNDGALNAQGAVDGDLTLNRPNGATGPSMDLTGNLTVGGTLDINNNALTPTNRGSLAVDAGDLTAGGVTNAGDLTIAATRSLTVGGDDLVNEAGGRVIVQTDGVVVGDIQNAVGAQVNVQDRAEVDGDITNLGIVSMGGRVDGTIQNGAGGAAPNTSAALTTFGNATITGGVDNFAIINANGGSFESGVENTASGSFNVGGNVSVTGSFLNDGRVSVVGSDPRTLTIAEDFAGNSVFTNNGTIDTGTGTLLINANETILNATSVITGNVQFGGGITNAGTFSFDGASDLNGNFSNIDRGDPVNNPGLTNVNAAVTANGFDVTNGGDFNVNGGGVILGAGTVTNNDQGTFDVAGNGRVEATNVINAGAGVFTIGPDASVNTTAGFANGGGGRVENSGTISGGFINNDTGTLNNVGTVNGGLTNNRGGIVTNTGRIVGDVANNNGGQLATSNRIEGNLTNAGTANASGVVTGNVVVNDGSLSTTAAGLLNVGQSLDINNAGNQRGSVTIGLGNMSVASATNAGDLTIGGQRTLTIRSGALTTEAAGVTTVDGTVSGAADVAGNGQMIVNGQVTGAVRNEQLGLVQLNGGQIGALTNAGVTRGGGTVNGGITNLDTGEVRTTADLVVNGTIANGGQVNITAGTLSTAGIGNLNSVVLEAGATLQLTNDGALQNGDGATAQLDGTVNGDVENFEGGTVTFTGTMTGDLVNDGAANLEGNITGDVTHMGTSFNLTGNLDVNGRVANLETIGFGQGDTMTATQLDNSGTLNFTGGAYTGALASDGTINAVDGTTFGGGLVRNAGAINLTGSGGGRTLSFGSGLDNTGGTVDMRDGFTGDTLNVQGGLTGGTYLMDLDFQTDGVAESTFDQIVVGSGAVTGQIVLDFNVITSDETNDRLLVLDVVDGAANAFGVTAVGLPANERRIFSLDADNNNGVVTGDVFVVQQVNPALGGIAGNVALTQSLIGSVINRPSSPFVTGLAYTGDDPCGYGGWGRIIGGEAEASGATSNNIGDFASEIDASYAGMQLGGDFACFNGVAGGWDLAVGAIGGINNGSTTQPVFAIDPLDPTRLSDTLASVTTSDFDQYYGGIYATGARRIGEDQQFAFDLQYRLERTDFAITNEGRGGRPGLGLDETEFSSTAQTLSGSISYAVPIRDTKLSVVPTAGFALTNLKTDDVVFDDGSRLIIDDGESRTAFVGATLSRTVVQPSGTSALNQFITATYYNDFGDDLTSTFINAADGSTDQLSSSNLGSYTEISAGLNYLRLLEPDQLGNARQMNASIRGDYRTGGSLDSWGITAQVRIQF